MLLVVKKPVALRQGNEASRDASLDLEGLRAVLCRVVEQEVVDQTVLLEPVELRRESRDDEMAKGESVLWGVQASVCEKGRRGSINRFEG